MKPLMVSAKNIGKAMVDGVVVAGIGAYVIWRWMIGKQIHRELARVPVRSSQAIRRRPIR